MIQYEKNVTTIIRDINDSFWEREIRYKNWSYSNYGASIFRFTRKGFIKALEKEGYGEKNIEYQNAQGDFGTAQIIANSFKNDNKDLY